MPKMVAAKKASSGSESANSETCYAIINDGAFVRRDGRVGYAIIQDEVSMKESREQRHRGAGAGYLAEGQYEVGVLLVGVLVFIGSWIACSVMYGFLGFAIGWLPSLILGALIGLLWPLVLILLVASGVLAALYISWLSSP